MEQYNFDAILYDGTNGLKIVKLDLPGSCTTVKESLSEKVWKLSYIARKAGGTLVKPEYKEKENLVSSLEVRSLKDYYGLTLPEDLENPVGRANGCQIHKVDAIFTRDKRIYLAEQFRGLSIEDLEKEKVLEEILKETIKKYVNPVFTLNSWGGRFVEHVPRQNFLPKNYEDNRLKKANIVLETNASKIMKRDNQHIEKEPALDAPETAIQYNQPQGPFSNFFSNLMNRIKNVRIEH